MKFADVGVTLVISKTLLGVGAGVGVEEGVALGAGVDEAAGEPVGKGNGFREGKGNGLKKEATIGTASKLVSIYYGQ